MTPRDAKAALVTAIDAYANAKHEAGHRNGFRLGGGHSEELRRSEIWWWNEVDQRRARMDNALRVYAAAIRRGTAQRAMQREGR